MRLLLAVVVTYLVMVAGSYMFMPDATHAEKWGGPLVVIVCSPLLIYGLMLFAVMWQWALQ